VFEYQLIRSPRRKSIALQVQRGKVKVRAPLHVPAGYIEQLIEDKKSWLSAKLLMQQQEPDEGITFKDGGPIWLKGQPKVIKLQFANHNSVNESNDTLLVTLKENVQSQSTTQQQTKIKQLLADWFKTSAIAVLEQKLLHFCPLLNLHPTSIKVRFYKARWGSCNSRGELSFNYLLMMTPDWVIDYVVVHELCHLQHLNHSAQFWSLVEQYFPHYKEAKLWLKTHQSQLQWP